MFKSYFLFIIFLSCSISLVAQTERIQGKIIKDYGATFKVDNPDIKTDTSQEFKLILDISSSSKDKSVINKNIVTAARFLNMHANEGISKEKLNVAMTVHAGAWQDILTNEAYKERFGVENPNLELINKLTEAGADIIICGQTAAFRGIKKEEINPNVKLALSAMTALIQYQKKGYTFIKF
jgi:intracellular sulfur oxidation DsrE/DsrF family protein